MDQTTHGFKTEEQMGLFTFYKMQEEKQSPFQVHSSIVRPENKNNKLAPIPKLSVLNQKKESPVKRRVHSVVDCQKQMEQIQTSKVTGRNLKVNKKKFSEAVSQQKHSVIDFSFDFSPSRRKNAGIQLFESSASQRTKTTNPIQQQEQKQWDLYSSKYFHSVHLMKIKQIKKEEMKQLFRSHREPHQHQNKVKVKHRTEIQKFIVDQMQEADPQNGVAGPKLKQDSLGNRVKKGKQEPLNFLQYLQQKKKRMTQEYKKVRLNKKIGDILNLKLNDNYPFKLKRVGFDRSEIAYMIPSCRYPLYQ